MRLGIRVFSYLGRAPSSTPVEIWPPPSPCSSPAGPCVTVDRSDPARRPSGPCAIHRTECCHLPFPHRPLSPPDPALPPPALVCMSTCASIWSPPPHREASTRSACRHYSSSSQHWVSLPTGRSGARPAVPVSAGTPSVHPSSCRPALVRTRATASPTSSPAPPTPDSSPLQPNYLDTTSG
jgi:hypothetical protein